MAGYGYDYDQGYEDAWDGASKKGTSQAYRDGYETGQDDACLNDMGYDDAKKGKAAEYPRDPFYMDGYNEGSKKRR
jgi:hypothetical protein